MKISPSPPIPCRVGFQLPDWFSDLVSLLVDERGLDPLTLATSRVAAGGFLAVSVLAPQSVFFAFVPKHQDEVEIREVRWSNAVSFHPPSAAVAFGRTWFQFIDLDRGELQSFCSSVKQYPEQSDRTTRRAK